MDSLVTLPPEPFNPLQSSALRAVESIIVTEPEAKEDSPPATAAAAPQGAIEVIKPVEAEAAPVAVEAPTKQKTSESPEQWAKRFERLSKRDMEQRQREKVLAEKETQVAQAYKLMEMARSRDLRGVLGELGVTTDDVLKNELSGGRPDPNDRIAALEKKLEEVTSLAREGRGKSEEVNDAFLSDKVASWQNEFDGLLDTPDYKIIKHWKGAKEQIEADVADYYRKNKKILPAKTVLDNVAKELRDRYDSVNKHLSPAPAPAPTKPSVTNNGPRTLEPKLSAMPRYSYVSDEQEELAALIAKYDSRR